VWPGSRPTSLTPASPEAAGNMSRAGNWAPYHKLDSPRRLCCPTRRSFFSFFPMRSRDRACNIAQVPHRVKQSRITTRQLMRVGPGFTDATSLASRRLGPYRPVGRRGRTPRRWPVRPRGTDLGQRHLVTEGLAEAEVPGLRRIEDNRSASGSAWIGLQRRHDHVVAGVAALEPAWPYCPSWLGCWCWLGGERDGRLGDFTSGGIALSVPVLQPRSSSAGTGVACLLLCHVDDRDLGERFQAFLAHLGTNPGLFCAGERHVGRQIERLVDPDQASLNSARDRERAVGVR
jgi:hypothetical protein